MELVAIKVRIGLDHKNHHRYPAFNALPSGVREGLDWSRFVDKYGGWLYDKKAGHRETDDESPAGYWFGVVIVPELFAVEAADLFSKDIEVLNENDLRRFYEERVTHNQPEILDDLEILQALAAKKQLGIALSDDDQMALDPDSEHRGRRRNKEKQLSDMMANRGVSISSAATQRAKLKHQAARERANRG